MADDAQNSPHSKAALLWVRGLSKVDIAEELGISRKTVAEWLALPEVQEEVAALQQGMRESARRAGTALVGKVARVWDAALDADSGEVCKRCGGGLPDHAIRLRAADSVADRFGLPKTEVQEVVASLTMADKDDAAVEREVLTEAAAILDRQGKHELALELRAVTG